MIITKENIKENLKPGDEILIDGVKVQVTYTFWNGAGTLDDDVYPWKESDSDDIGFLINNREIDFGVICESDVTNSKFRIEKL